MWLMQDTLIRSTHKVADRFLASDTTHCPPQARLSDFNPSTALFAFPSPGAFPVCGYFWYAGLFKAMFSTRQTIPLYIYNWVYVVLNESIDQRIKKDRHSDKPNALYCVSARCLSIECNIQVNKNYISNIIGNSFVFPCINNNN